MNVFFVTAIAGLKIKSDLGQGVKIDDFTFLTNNKKKVQKEIHPNFRSIIGNMEYQGIFNSEALIYAKETIPKELTPEQFLVAKLYKAEKFHSALWMLKDSCVNNELGFLFYTSNGVPNVSSNFIAIVNSTALGEIKSTTTITKTELKREGSFCKNNINVGNVHSMPTTQLLKGNDRISRAYYLVQAARSQSDLAIKISNYCTAFESLFATSRSELTHKLSERVAYFLENDSSARIDIFKSMKKAYMVRSKTVHGDTLKENFIEELKQISKTCDHLIRRVMVCVLKNEKIREVFLGTPDQIDDLFLKLIFGKYEICEYYPNKTYKEIHL